MGLFRSRSRTEPVSAGVAVDVVDPDLARAVVLRLVESQAEGDAAARAAMSDLSRVSGLPLDLLEQTKRIASEPDLYTRPWRWLAAAAEQALREGDVLTPARAYAFTALFVREIAPRMTMLDAQETGLVTPDRERVRVLARTASAALASMPEGEVIVPSSGVTREVLAALLRDDLPEGQG